MGRLTRASHARIAARAAKHEFIRPPAGMLSEEVDLGEPFGLVLGLIHPEGSPMLVVAWNGQRLTRMLPEEASAWADDLIAAGQAVPLAPVIAAIRKLVKRVGDIVSETIMRQLDCEGRA